MIEEVRKNVDAEIEMLREISTYSRRLEVASTIEQKLLEGAIQSLRTSMKLVNQSIPVLLNDVSTAQPLTPKAISKASLEQVQFKQGASQVLVTIPKATRQQLLAQLSISESLIKRLRKKQSEEKEEFSEFRAARGDFKFANRFFRTSSVKWLKKGYFQGLSLEIKKANMDILAETYVSMIFLSCFISIFVGLFLAVFFFFFSLGLSAPFIFIYTGDYLLRLAYVGWLPFGVPVLTFFALYTYPSTEKSTLSKRIDQELPFAVIHMSAISGSGIEPTEIFKIIGLSHEYPYLRREIRKVLNQINIYGYDLVTALNNVAKTSPSIKLAEVFSGLGTTIHSGGSLNDYFERRSETLLTAYRLEREKFTKVAETFMDIYISAVIAAPMILMLLLIMISVSGINFGFSPNQMTFLIILIVSLINVGFIGFLQIKQPSY